MALSVLRNNSKDVPSKIKNISNYAYSDEVLLQKYNDKKLILFISNFKESVDNLRSIYNIENRGVDKLNQKMSYYTTNRKEYKWWKKIFLFGINSCCINSRILFELSRNTTYKECDFNKKLVEEIFQEYKNHKNKLTIIDDNLNLEQNEFNTPEDYIESSNNYTIYKPARKKFKYHTICKDIKLNKKCAYCKDKKTNYYCKECELVLHPECFSAYHNEFVI